MKLNKTVAKTMVFALAFGMLPSVSPVKAAGGATAFSNKTGLVTLEDTSKVWGIAKPIKAKDKAKANVLVSGEYYKVTGVEEYKKGIDATALGYGKDLIIAHGPSTEIANGVYKDWKVLKIKAADKNFKAVYLGEENGKIGKTKKAASALGGAFGYLAAEASDATGKKAVELDLAAKKENVFVQSGEGSWLKLADFIGKDVNATNVNGKLQGLIQKGANLKIRYAADDTSWFKETKVKVATQPKAPKVGVDVVNGLITSLKKELEYQAVESTADIGETWKQVGDKGKTASIKDTVGAGFNATKTYHLFARTKAAKNKVVSKISKITLKGQEDITLKAADNTEAPEYLLIDGTEAGGFTHDVKIALERKFDTNSDAVLVNESNIDYEFFLNATAITGENLPEKGKWVTLRGMKNAEAKPTKVKLKYSKAAKASTHSGAAKFSLLIRKAGTKLKGSEATLPSGTKNAGITFKKIAQAGSIAGAGTTDNTGAVAVTYKAGEGAEGSFTYKLTNHQKFDKKPKIEIVKKDGVSVKVSNFEEDTDGTSGVATVTFKLDKKASADSIVQTLKLSAEGAEAKAVTITFTKGG